VELAQTRNPLRSRAGLDLAAMAAGFAVPYLLVYTLAWRPFGTVVGPGFWSILGASAALWVRYRQTGRPLASLGLGVPVAPARAILALAVGLLATALVGNFLQPWLAAHFGSGTVMAASRFHELQGQLVPTIATIVVVAWFGAAFAEELVFRGGVMRSLQDCFGAGAVGRIAAIALQAALFAGIHAYQGAPGALMAGAIGLVFGGTVYLAKGSLWPVMLIHAVPDTMTLIRIYQGQ
jgi:membrane protease YdiL (CAAX protease family)